MEVGAGLTAELAELLGKGALLAVGPEVGD